MYISSIRIQNFRNFRDTQFDLEKHCIIVGGNKAGKSNLIKALQLAIDPNLSPNARKLQASDFFDAEPPFNGRSIVVEVDILLESHETTSMNSLRATVHKEGESPKARFTYRFEPDPLKIPVKNGTTEDTETDEANESEEEVRSLHPSQYRYVWFPGNREDEAVNSHKLNNYLSLTILDALRDTQELLSTWSRSPLKTLLENADIARDFLQSTAQNIREQVKPLGSKIQPIVTNVEDRSKIMVGNIFTVGSSLNIVTDEPEDLLRSVKLYVDGTKQRSLTQASLGTLNVLYLALLLEEAHQEYLKRQKQHNNVSQQTQLPGISDSAANIVPEQQMFLALEEPEAHLHPHVQRSIFRYFLAKESAIKSLLVTTHSPHIASVAGVERILILRHLGDIQGTEVSRVSRDLFDEDERDDINRYLDVTRGELLFARGVLFVEGTAELYIVPAFASLLGINLDYLGISIVSVQGTDFIPFVKLVSERGLNIPFAVLTDGDNATNIDDEGQEITLSLSPGEKRGLDLLVASGVEVAEGANNAEVLMERGVFVGNHTLEVDLLQYYEEEIFEVYSHLVKTQTARTNFKADIETAKLGDANRFLDKISRKGKGRFAQKLAPYLSKDRCPKYIEMCLRYISSLV